MEAFPGEIPESEEAHDPKPLCCLMSEQRLQGIVKLAPEPGKESNKERESERVGEKRVK